MNKKILALAVSQYLFAAASAAGEEGNITLYGQANLALEVTSHGRTATDRSTRANVGSNGSRLGVKGWEDLGNGLRVVFLMEASADGLDSGVAPGGTSLFGAGREGYVGLSAAWGTVALGFYGQPYKTSTGALDVFAGIIADYASILGNAHGVNLYDTSLTNSVIYFAPKLNGLSGQLQYGFGESADPDTDRWGAQFNYSNGPWYATYAHAAQENFNGANDRSANKIAGSYTFNGATMLIAMVESLRSDEDGGANARTSDRNAWYLGLTHKLGNNTLRLAYAQARDSDGTLEDDGARFWALGVSHALSKRAELYGLFVQMDNQRDGTYGLGQTGSTNAVGPVAAGEDPHSFVLGMKFSF